MLKLKRAMKGSEGFTLMEIVVVLAVVALLAAALTPMILTYLEDAKKAQAQNDTLQIAAAIAAFLKDTGLPPYKRNTDVAKVPGFGTGDAECLVGPGNEFLTATDATSGQTWLTSATGKVDCSSGGGKRDTIENHLINNTPGDSADKKYQTTGKNAAKQPYIPRVNEDPWGNKYLVNIKNANPADKKAVWAISAGPDGILQTSSDLNAAATLTASGDDIIARAK